MNMLKMLSRSYTSMACLLAGVILCGNGLSAQLPEKAGDFDNDDNASILDVVRLINHVSQTDPLPNELLPYGDVNNDGYVKLL